MTEAMEGEPRDPELELDEREPAVLPAREAMSLISPDATPSFIPELPPTADATTSAQDAAVDAQGSASGEESVSSDDRSEHISNQDTATAES
jgi:hypothetical protein